MELDKLPTSNMLIRNESTGDYVHLCPSCSNNVQKLQTDESNLRIEISKNINNEQMENAEIEENNPALIHVDFSHQSPSHQEEEMSRTLYDAKKQPEKEEDDQTVNGDDKEEEEEPQIQPLNAEIINNLTIRDNEAKKQHGIDNVEVLILQSNFEEIIKDDIQQKQRGKKRKHSDTDQDIRTALRLLKNHNRVPKRPKKTTEMESESENDGYEDEGDFAKESSQASTSSYKAAKPRRSARNKKSKKPLSARRMNNSNNSDSDDGEWLSKECSRDRAKLSKLGVKEDMEVEGSESDATESITSSEPEKRKLTREEYQKDKEIQKLLKDAKASRKNKRVIDSDDEDEPINGDKLDTDGFDVLTLEKKSSTKPAKKESGKKESKKKMTAKKQHKEKVDRSKKENATKPKKRKAFLLESDDEDMEELLRPLFEKQMNSDEEDEEDEDEKKPKSKGKSAKKKARKAQQTKDAEKAEKERRKRLEERQKEFNGIELVTEGDEIHYSGGVLVPQLKNVALDPDNGSEEPTPVQVHPSLVRVLKKHQAEGIQFIYNCTIESLSKLNEKGGGCILGHCMGLGKTLQIITFLHTIMMHPKIGKHINKVLIVVPMNVILNWVEEFKKWLYNNDIELDTIHFCDLITAKTNQERLAIMENWAGSDQPFVLIIGYEMYRNLTLIEADTEHLPKVIKKKKKDLEKGKKKKPLTKNQRELEKMKPKFRKLLHEVPHMLICDEGHKLKSAETSLFCTIRHIKTQRRVCLTGTPMQNNLEEYFCMVDFVKPSLLGTLEEFKDRFSDPIKAGRAKDATQWGVRRMRHRSHILYERLRGILDRRDYSILAESLPPKQDYVIFVRLTERQCKIYAPCVKFLLNILELEDSDLRGKGWKLVHHHHILYRVWTHPYLVVEHEKRKARKQMLEDMEKELDDFIVDDNEEEELEEDIDDEELGADEPSTSAMLTSNSGRKRAPKTRLRNASGKTDIADQSPERETETPPELLEQEWAKNLVSETDRDMFELSNKLMLLVEIIKKCEQIGDKLLVFSQYLDSIALIERMLAYMIRNDQWFVNGHAPLMANGGEDWAWHRGIDYDVIDGTVSSQNRSLIQEKFNESTNFRNRLLLISTRAGSLGTNLVGANRVVIFDCTWNPSHDTQGLFRVYRFGQTKPIYVYRLIAQGTMEERIYNRQVTKESISKRVTESAQIERHYTMDELEIMYQFNPAPLSDPNSLDRPNLNPPKDRLLGDIILSGSDIIVNYHTHDMLFNELEDEKLSQEERDQAWADFEKERQPHQPPHMPLPRLDSNGQPIQPPPPGQLGSTTDFFLQQQQVHMEMQQQNKEANKQQVKKNKQTTSTIEESPATHMQNEFIGTMNTLYQNYGIDSFYEMCFGISGMTREMAMKLYKIKQFLCYFVYKIPRQLVGQLDNADKFNEFFMRIVQNAKACNFDYNWVYDKVITALGTTIKLVKNVPECMVGVNYVICEFPDVHNAQLPT